MAKRPSTPPSFAFVLRLGNPDRRGTRAMLWGFVFFVGAIFFTGIGPFGGSSRLGPLWLGAAWVLGHVVCACLAHAARWPRSRADRWLAAWYILGLPLMLVWMLHTGSGDRGREPTRAEVDAFLAKQTTRYAIGGRDEDVLSWSAVVQDMPGGEQRDRLVADFSRGLVQLLDRGDFMPDDSLAAAAAAGALQGEAARALLTTARPRRGPAELDPEQAARDWLASSHDLTDPQAFARAVAVHEVLPWSPELGQLVAAALEATDEPLPARKALTRLQRLVRLADLTGVSADVPAFRERVREALLLLHRDATVDSDEPVGFVDCSEGPGSSLVHPNAMHAALQLMDRFGVPESIDLPRLRSACARRAMASYDVGHQVVSQHDAAILARRWPSESAPRFTLFDAGGGLALLLLALAVLDIRRQPLHGADGPLPALVGQPLTEP